MKERIRQHKNKGREIIYLDESGFAQSMPLNVWLSVKKERDVMAFITGKLKEEWMWLAPFRQTFLTLSFFSSY